MFVARCLFISCLLLIYWVQDKEATVHKGLSLLVSLLFLPVCHSGDSIFTIFTLYFHLHGKVPTHLFVDLDCPSLHDSKLFGSTTHSSGNSFIVWMFAFRKNDRNPRNRSGFSTILNWEGAKHGIDNDYLTTIQKSLCHALEQYMEKRFNKAPIYVPYCL